jgi:hypothetical protein
MTAAEVYNRLRRIAHFWNPLATDDDITELLSLLRIVDRRIVEGDLPRLAEEFVDEVGVAPELVMVDYLGYYANSVRGGSPYERVSRAAISLKEEGKAIGAALIVPHQAGRSTAGGTPVDITDARDSGVIEDTADIVMSSCQPPYALALLGGGRVSYPFNRRRMQPCLSARIHNPGDLLNVRWSRLEATGRVAFDYADYGVAVGGGNAETRPLPGHKAVEVGYLGPPTFQNVLQHRSPVPPSSLGHLSEGCSEFVEVFASGCVDEALWIESHDLPYPGTPVAWATCSVSAPSCTRSAMVSSRARTSPAV